MSDATYALWYFIHGQRIVSPVSVLPNETIGDLKKKIYHEADQSFSGYDAPDLILTKVDVNLHGIDGVEDVIYEGKYQIDPADVKPLRDTNEISHVWPQPSRDQLHVYVVLPANKGSPTLFGTVGESIGHVDLLRDYEDIFIKVNAWSTFEQSDIERNRIFDAENIMAIPDFVRTFEQKLVRKPCVSLKMHTLLQESGIPGSCFELPEDSISKDESHKETRYAGLLEVVHTACHVSLYDWKKAWQRRGAHKSPSKEHMANSIFFDPILYDPNNRMAIASQDKSWPITVIVKRESVESDDEPRKYAPRSDFLISHSSLPRLLVEVNSTSVNSWPMDLIRMLTTGAFIVRFANRFLNAFCEEKNFVLCAIFIGDDGTAIRHSLFQQNIQNDEAVYYTTETLSLNDSAGRIELVRHLYNLLYLELDQGQDQETRSAIFQLNNMITRSGMMSMYTKDGINSGKRTATGNGNRAGGRGGDDRAQLRAHGYEVKPEVVVDASGGEWEPLFKRPDHILTVYRPMDSNKEFIAKKIRENSNELEMLRLLNAFPLKSDHVISLIDSFHGWAILPKMVAVKGYVEFAPNLSESKVSEICLGLIKGLAYLHEHRIAHRDIKPDNLLLDGNRSLKIIDFDIAMRVEDEDEEVDDQCGTKNWMAPEVAKKLRHSPIKADRWACGRVLLFLLDKFGKEGGSLRAFARNLVAHNAKQRPSLLEWSSYCFSAPLLSDIGTVWNFDASRASRPRRDPVEVDGENMKPPNVKKQRLDGSGTSTICAGSETYDGLGLMIAVG